MFIIGGTGEIGVMVELEERMKRLYHMAKKIGKVKMRADSSNAY